MLTKIKARGIFLKKSNDSFMLDLVIWSLLILIWTYKLDRKFKYGKCHVESENAEGTDCHLFHCGLSALSASQIHATRLETALHWCQRWSIPPESSRMAERKDQQNECAPNLFQFHPYWRKCRIPSHSQVNALPYTIKTRIIPISKRFPFKLTHCLLSDFWERAPCHWIIMICQYCSMCKYFKSSFFSQG